MLVLIHLSFIVIISKIYKSFRFGFHSFLTQVTFIESTHHCVIANILEGRIQFVITQVSEEIFIADTKVELRSQFLSTRPELVNNFYKAG